MAARSLRFPTLAALLLAGTPALAGALQINAGVQCRPATSADVPKLEYLDGSASNVAAAPGTSAQNASVACALPAVPPNHRMVRASVYYLDPDRRWAKCTFYNAYPGIAPRTVGVTSVPERPWIGVATMTVDGSTFVPGAVRCTVKPGQTIYGVETENDAL